MEENNNKEKVFLVVTLSKNDKDDPTNKIWESPKFKNCDFYSIMNKLNGNKKLNDDEKRFLVYLKIRAAGCWENKKFFDAVNEKNKDCYILAKSASKVMAIYKVSEKYKENEIDSLTADTIDSKTSCKTAREALLDTYMGKYGNLFKEEEKKSFIPILADPKGKGCRFKVEDCEFSLIEKYCSAPIKVIQGSSNPAIYKTQWEFENTYLDTAKSAENNIINLMLRGTKQIVLTGAPGTGKTYLANKIAEKLAKGITLEQLKGKEDFDENKEEYKEEQIELVQFHASYDYSDFMEGLKPVAGTDGSLSFEVRDGSFRAFCEKAKNDTENKYIFIIDEINRADLSKVFGELMYGLEYRNKPFVTQYAQWRDEEHRKFTVPDNIYIIGTMNDIDRSVETFDFALRRRFMWYEIKASESYSKSVISNMAKEQKLDKELVDLLAEFSNIVNKELIKRGEEYNITESHKIGPAYFDPSYIYKNQKVTKDDINDIKRDIWDLRIEPIIKEYVRGYNKSDEFIEKLCKEVLNAK